MISSRRELAQALRARRGGGLRGRGVALAVAGAAFAPAAPALAAEAANREHTAARSLAVARPGVAPPLALAWRHDHGTAYHDVIAAGGGRVFAFGSEHGSGPGAFEALDARTGAVLWSRAVEAQPAVAYGEGRLIATIRDGERDLVQSLDPGSGAARWTVELRPGATTGYPLVHGGRVFVPAQNRLDAYRLGDGARLWSADTPGPVPPSGPAVVGDSVLTAGSEGLWSFSVATGARRFAGGDSPARYGPNVVGSDGTHVFGYFHDGSGNRVAIWSAATGAQVTSTFGVDQPAVGRQRIFGPQSTSEGGAIDASTLRGHQVVKLWSIVGAGFRSPVLAGDVLYARTYDQHCLYAFDARTGATLWRSDPLATGSTFTGPPMVAEGAVFVGHPTGVAAFRGARGAPSGRCAEYPVRHTSAYDPRAPLPPFAGTAPAPAAPRVTARRQRGGVLRVTATGLPPRARVRLRATCGRRLVAVRAVRADAAGRVAARLRPRRGCARASVGVHAGGRRVATTRAR